MSRPDASSATHLTRRTWVGILLVWVAVSLPLIFLYLTSRRVVLNEIRNHAMGVAIAAAAGMDAGELTAVRGPADREGEAFQRIQRMLGRLVDANPDVRYIYTMRRAQAPFAPAYAFEYVVDQAPRDFNQNGRIDDDERSEPPGQPYDASALPAMQEAWNRPSADRDITADPPYPELISGYAPVRDAMGRTVALVGVDVTASTFQQKMRAIQVVMVIVWLVLCALITMVVHLYYLQAAAFEQNKKMSEELATRNEMLRKANAELAARSAPPVEPPDGARRVFDSYFLACAAAGPALANVLEIDQDHAGVYLADVSGPGPGASLVSSLLAVAAGPSDASQRATATQTALFTELRHPDALLASLNTVLAEELPPGARVSLAYLVINLADGAARYATAGLPAPLHFARKARRLVALDAPEIPALGAGAGRLFAAHEIRVEAGDRLVFRTVPAGPEGTVPQLSPEVLRGEEIVRCLESDRGEEVAGRVLGLLCEAGTRARCSCLVVDVR